MTRAAPGSPPDRVDVGRRPILVLRSEHRMRRRTDFLAAMRGRRAGRPTVVAHLGTSPDAAPARVGFVVSRAVGGATTRNRIRRQLRHLVEPQVGQLPPGALLVLRALPPAATASRASLRSDTESSLARLLPATAPGRRR